MMISHLAGTFCNIPQLSHWFEYHVIESTISLNIIESTIFQCFLRKKVGTRRSHMEQDQKGIEGLGAMECCVSTKYYL
uniref:Uncharacterized protein n=1 Tax=Arion vulgaris TaxID=1028688 RepID=A0A0B6YAW8_9EUPU